MVEEIKWNEKATEVFTQYYLDRKLGLEKDDPNEDVVSIDELR